MGINYDYITVITTVAIPILPLQASYFDGYNDA